MRRGLLVLLIVALLPLAIFAQEDIDSTYLSDEVKEKFGIEQTEDIVEAEEEPSAEPTTPEPEPLTIETPELPPAGSARDSPFYALDRVIERLQLRLTTDKVAKAELHLRFAEERLAEAKKLIELNKPEFAKATVKDYDNELTEAELELESAKEEGADIEDVVQRVSEMTSKHIEVLQRVLEQVPDTAKSAIMKAVNISQRSQEVAIQRLEQIRAEKELKLMQQEAKAEEALEEVEIEESVETEELEENKTEEAKEETEGEKGTREESTTRGKGWH